ncbi:ATP-dependent DNA helicase RecG [Arcanobacterium pinnipediorum]|uniref:Probable DNA 3'-5' helicase RecG n=1 Tax=Arcanobacterium pinnipediorum TaxID=1503041 RepID=A0ABY5AF63_9ACTO|nr:ATP-dependent DNA helicase RecG [Arcanobacterium pinnipediorum]USR78844.1 ATP-dependent DNA helicase RecG [Arcanobacterium pinnipediorum]
MTEEPRLDTTLNDDLKPQVDPSPQSAIAADAWTALSRPLERIIGKRSANALAKIGLETVEDLINYAPFRIAQRGQLLPIEHASEGESVTVVANVVATHLRPMNNRTGFILNVTISDGQHDLDLAFFAKHKRPLSFHETQLTPGTMATFSGTVSAYRGRLQLAHPQYEIMEDLADLDNAQIIKPVPIYHSTAKVPSWHIQRAIATVLPTLSASQIPDPLPAQYRETHQLLSRYDAILAIHQPQDSAQWHRARHRFAHEEAFVLQVALAQQANQASKLSAPRCTPQPDGIAHEFDRRLPFRLTSSQRSVGRKLSETLSTTTPMRCLLQGDVGAGKTIVALRAMLQVVDAGYQAVFVAPTEVLAHQHYATFTQMLENIGQSGELEGTPSSIPVHLLTGSLTASQRRQTLANLASGQPGIVVGTHALFSDNVQLGALGFVVIDEQHRFGVDQRDRLAHHAHLLVMTATPIPRTLAMTVFGDLDVEILQARKHANISTTVVPADNERWMARVWQRAREEVESGGRVFVVCPQISPTENDAEADLVDQHLTPTDIPDNADVLTLSQRLRSLPFLAGIGIGILHGQMPSSDKTQAMTDFIAGTTQILVSTTVIEVGVDIPQATLMIIMDAQRFGLSQLHQLRGRVGRGTKPGLCLAITSAIQGSLAAQRVQAFAATNDGFELAEADIALRSVGDVMGTRQSGAQSSLRFISVVNDKTIIEQARSSARDLVKTDPDLVHHRPLAIAISDINVSNRQYLEKN